MKDQHAAQRTVYLTPHSDEEKEKGRRGLLTAVFFFIFVFFLIATALFFRLVAFLSNSTFDGAHRYTIAVASQEKGAAIHVLSFAPETRSIHVLRIPKKNTAKDVVATTASVQRYLVVPIEGSLVMENIPDTLIESDISRIIKDAAFSQGVTKTDIHPSDFYKLWWYVINVPPGNIDRQVDVISESEDAMDQQMAALFSENTLTAENKSVRIINATGTFGVGNKLARMLSNMGVNVVLVTTAKELQRRSEISYSGESSYTLERLAHLLRFPIILEQDHGIADIIITIGREGLERLEF